MPTTKTSEKTRKTRAALLAEIADLPASAFVSTAHAAAYIGSTPDVLFCWRSQRRGPRYYGALAFIRYRIADLDSWMASRADEIRAEDSVDKPNKTEGAAKCCGAWPSPGAGGCALSDDAAAVVSN
jgi:hypothetical protein